MYSSLNLDYNRIQPALYMYHAVPNILKPQDLYHVRKI